MRTFATIPIAIALTAAAFAQTDWPTYLHDSGGMLYSPLKQIDTTNAAKGARLRGQSICP